MTHKDSGWSPDDGDAMQYKGDTIEDHAVGASQINDGEQEPDLDDD